MLATLRDLQIALIPFRPAGRGALEAIAPKGAVSDPRDSGNAFPNG